MKRFSFTLLLLAAAAPALASDDDSRVAIAPPAPFGPQYLLLEPLETTIAEDGRMAGTIRIELALEMKDAAAAAALSDHQPVLREAAVMALSDFAGWQASAQLPVDGERLAVDLTRSITPRAKGLIAVRLLRVEAR